MAQGDPQHLGSARTPVGSPAQCVKDPALPHLQGCGLDLIPGLAWELHMLGAGQKKKKKKKRKEKRKKEREVREGF